MASQIITRKLSTGQTVNFNVHDERMVRNAYTYFAGFSKRQELIKIIQNKTSKSKQAKLQPLMGETTIHDDMSAVSEEDVNPLEKLEVETLEEMLESFEDTDHRITFDDIEALLRRLGASLSKKKIKTLIWECDEKGDWIIDWEEFQLTCFRNIHDTTGCEPNTFFRIIEFLTFDTLHKGFIVEDDCMDILFARYGSERLEQEMQTIFGLVRASSGGTGSLTLKGYLDAISIGKGKRSLLF